MSNNVSLDVAVEMAKGGFLERIKAHNERFNSQLEMRGICDAMVAGWMWDYALRYREAEPCC